MTKSKKFDPNFLFHLFPFFSLVRMHLEREVPFVNCILAVKVLQEDTKIERN